MKGFFYLGLLATVLLPLKGLGQSSKHYSSEKPSYNAVTISTSGAIKNGNWMIVDATNYTFSVDALPALGWEKDGSPPTSVNKDFSASTGGPENIVTVNYKTIKKTLEGDPENTDHVDANVYVARYEFPITINTFIPANYIDDPTPFSDTIFEGDDRGFDINGSFRTQQKFSLAAYVLVDADGEFKSHVPMTGESVSYQKSTSLENGQISAAARADTTNGPPMKLEWVYASTAGMSVTVTRMSDYEVKAECTVSVGNPLINSPNIDYDFTIEIDYLGLKNPSYRITGDHDGFPAYEVYIGNQMIHHYHHGNETPLALFPPMDRSVNNAGLIF